nr:uncharacterized protein LOC112427693 [Macaca nemestrina]
MQHQDTIPAAGQCMNKDVQGRHPPNANRQLPDCGTGGRAGPEGTRAPSGPLPACVTVLYPRPTLVRVSPSASARSLMPSWPCFCPSHRGCDIMGSSLPRCRACRHPCPCAGPSCRALVRVVPCSPTSRPAAARLACPILRSPVTSTPSLKIRKILLKTVAVKERDLTPL